MAFRNGVVTYARFRVRGGPTAVDQALLSALEENVLTPPPIGVPPELQAGWVGGRHVLDTDFSPESVVFGDQLIFGLRCDVNRVPTVLREAYRAMAERERSGTAKPDRRAAREEADDRCRRELSEGRHVRSKLLPVLWDVRERLLLAPATGDATSSAVRDLFAATFDGTLEPLSSGAMARERLETRGLSRDYEDLRPTPFTNAPPMATSEDGRVPLVPWSHAGPEPKDFLGNEFLIWVWAQSEIDSALFSTDRGEVAIALDRALDMSCAWDVTGTQSLRANGPTRLPEAIAALRLGKWPRKVGLVMAVEGCQWDCVFQADRFTVSGGRLPRPDEPPASEREGIEDRLSAIMTLDRGLAGCFNAFLDERISPSWASTRDRVREWIARGRAAATVEV